MIDRGRRSVLGVLVDVVDYENAVQRVLTAAKNREPLGVCPAASHAIMSAHLDPEYKFRLNNLGMVVPDGQPVRKALEVLHSEHLDERVYGPELTMQVCEKAAEIGISIYLYGSRAEVVNQMADNLVQTFPGLELAGVEPSAFRTLTHDEAVDLVSRIKSSGAGIVLAGLGCPRQEIWAYEMKDRCEMPILAVGAAFDFIAGTAKQAPPWMQRWGLEWLFRLMGDPKRLWRRYLVLGSRYLMLVMMQRFGLKDFGTEGRPPSQELNIG